MRKDTLNSSARPSLTGFVVSLVCALAIPQLAAAPDPAQARPVEVVLVDPGAVTPGMVSQWKAEGFKAAAVVLDEGIGEAVYRELAGRIADGGLELYWWIEVGRNPKLARAHPRWMAALGSHSDWQKRFPNSPEPGVGEVAKAFPWVPIGYREAFDAHLARIEQLLKHAPSGWRGLLLNDLQGGPSSCGCGNLQCRWAIDYHASPTATKLEGDDVAARFVAAVRQRVGDKAVIPVWTTECEEVDLPADKHQGKPGTGLCGTVGCATGACPEVFTRQWSALTSAQPGPIGLLALPSAFQRTKREFGGGPGWVTNSIAYLNQTLSPRGGMAPPADRLWVVVEGFQREDEARARELAAKAGVGAVIVARAKMDQSYVPRLIPAN